MQVTMVATDDEHAYETPPSGRKEDGEEATNDYYSASDGHESSDEAAQRLEPLMGHGEARLEAGFAMENPYYDDMAFSPDPDGTSAYCYRHQHGFRKYSNALKGLIPVRTAKDKSAATSVPVDQAGTYSLLSYSWLTGLMWRTFRHGLNVAELPPCSPLEGCAINGQRLEYIWEEELKKRGPEKASMDRVVWRFIRTRILVSLLLFVISLVAGFVGPTIFMRKLLVYAETPDVTMDEGFMWLGWFFILELVRLVMFAGMWVMNYRTALRLKSGCLSLLYWKVMRLRNLGDKSVGEFINLFANDGARIFEVVTYGPLVIGGPVVAIGGVVFIGWLLGGPALAGMATFVLFYPFQYVISRITGYLRRKTIKVTDERVRFMNEILTCVKLIKLYAWEKPFSKTISGIRQNERRLLEKAAYVQSTSIAMAPTVPIIAAIITFLAHIGAGNNLTASEAYSVWGLYHVIRYTFAQLSFSLNSMIEMQPSLERMELSFSSFELLVTYYVAASMPLAFSAWSTFQVLRYSLAVLPYALKSIIEAQQSIVRMEAFSVIGCIMLTRSRLAVMSQIVQAITHGSNALQRLKAFTVMALNVVIRGQFVNFTFGMRTVAELWVSHRRLKAFTAITILNTLNFVIRVIPLYANQIVNGRIGLERFKSVLLMEDKKQYVEVPSDANHAICLTGATFAWDVPTIPEKHKKEKKKHIENGKPKKHTKKKELKVPLPEAETIIGKENEETFPLTNRVINTLFDVSFVIQKGQLVGVCGSVGSGKSSLISSILGQMRLVSGHVALQGRCAYVAQQAWIINTSVKENILFGEPLDPKRYYEAVHSCCLNPDFTALPAADETEIGERGVNLSGGQKQRVSLARAVYSNRDIYLLDDPLSAVDAHVGKHIFEECILGVLKNKSVLFVTHQLQYLSSCDHVLFVKDGQISEQGTHEELVQANGGYAELIRTFHSDDDSGSPEQLDNNESDVINVKSPLSRQSQASFRERSISAKRISTSKELSNGTGGGQNDAVQDNTAGRLMTKEKQEQGSISMSTYLMYMRAAGGFIVSFIVLFSFMVNIGTTAFSSWWLSQWLTEGSGGKVITNPKTNVSYISDNITDNPELPMYQLVYGLSIVFILVTSFIRSFLFMKVTLKASSKLHDHLFSRMIRSPMSFFDTTPIGRILNLFSLDMDEIDVRLPFVMETFLQNVWVIFFSLLFVCLAFPWFLIPLAVLLVLFFFLYNVFRVAVRDLKRFENTTRSPIYSHVTATIQGLGTIHAYQKEKEFIESFTIHIDNNTGPFFLFHCAMRWLALRLDLLVIFITLITGVFVVCTHGNITAAMAGLALSYAAQLTGLFQYTVRLSTETEARFTSVERIHKSIVSSETEAPAIIEAHRPHPGWPTKGKVEFMGASMRYRPGLPLVLNAVTFAIDSKEKIGIVGRTGSGKSSLGNALFRIVELSSGIIFIDDTDISTIGLEDLRSRMSLIPQDPVLFIGTVRYNLDPFDLYTDEQLWGALERTYMKDKITALEKQLQATVVENGENFSVGERQLICMARALLRNSKILLLDEATAAIDTQTDALIQTTIREAFADCTILTIAHRLNTVLACDRIMVLEDGVIVEMGKPSVLVGNPRSKFGQMMIAAAKTPTSQHSTTAA